MAGDDRCRILIHSLQAWTPIKSKCIIFFLSHEMSLLQDTLHGIERKSYSRGSGGRGRSRERSPPPPRERDRHGPPPGHHRYVTYKMPIPIFPETNSPRWLGWVIPRPDHLMVMGASSCNLRTILLLSPLTDKYNLILNSMQCQA